MREISRNTDRYDEVNGHFLLKNEPINSKEINFRLKKLDLRYFTHYSDQPKKWIRRSGSILERGKNLVFSSDSGADLEPIQPPSCLLLLLLLLLFLLLLLIPILLQRCDSQHRNPAYSVCRLQISLSLHPASRLTQNPP